MRLHVDRTAPVLACIGVIAAVTFSSAPARAQGFGLYEQGACMMGRAGAGVAAPCDDGSSIFFNPAGLALGTGTVVSAGVTGIAPRGTFTDSTTSLVSTLNAKTFAAPSAYFATGIGRRAVIGVGLFAPYGLTSDWPPTSEGRFLGYKSAIKSLYVQPTIAARVSDRVSVGAGLDITHTSLELHRRVDLATLPITGTPYTFGAIGVPAGSDFADVALNGSGVRAGAHLGIIIKANDRVSLGGRYLFRQSVSIDNGTLATTQIPTNLSLRVPLPGLPVGTPLDLIVKSAFASGGSLGPQTATTKLPLPDQLVLGIAVQATPRLKVLADYQFTHWSLFDQVVITYQFAPQTVLVESYKDTHGLRVGAEYAIGKAVVRGGVDAHTAGAPDQSVTPLLPEAPRTEYAAGATLPFSGHVGLDLAYMYINQSDRHGRTGDGGLAVPTAAVNNGLYHYYANLYSASVVIRF